MTTSSLSFLTGASAEMIVAHTCDTHIKTIKATFSHTSFPSPPPTHPPARTSTIIDTHVCLGTGVFGRRGAATYIDRRHRS